MTNTDVVIVGAGPTGLFCAHQLGIIGLKCEIVDNLDKIGGQCIELYPDKPIYDIPAIPECTGEELTNSLIEQIKPFNFNFHLNERVQEIKNENNKWILKTSKGKEFNTPNIVIAGGVGSFEPRKFPTKSCEKFEGKSVLYSIKNKSIFKNKTVVIFGGGDSALDWAIELSKDSKVTLIHRRDEFRGAQGSVEKVKELQKNNKLEVITKYSIKDVKGNEKLESVEIKDESGQSKTLKTDYVLGFFGLIMQLGPILNWGLNLDKKHIPVNTENFETNQKGIFAIGDICTYPGKLKLILSGFHEGALAARGCFKYARPDENLRFEFSTTSKSVHERLGIKK
jgi:thioredoxin reductase (NADPH)